jgi:hypothetical protein
MLSSYKASKPCEISGSHSGAAENSSFLGCYTMLTGKELLLGLPDPEEEGLWPFSVSVTVYQLK